MIRNSKKLVDLMVERATAEAAKIIITFMASQCQEYDAQEGKDMVEYLRKCKKSISQKIDEAIVEFEKWR